MHRPYYPLPLVGQFDNVPPSGRPDPAASTDCGEASLLCLNDACGGPSLTLTQVRQELGLPSSDGRTTGEELAAWLNGHGFSAVVNHVSVPKAVSLVRAGYKLGTAFIALGFFAGFNELHWNVIGTPEEEGLWTMDPFFRAHLFRSRQEFAREFMHVLVMVHVG